jgi:membrane associated rhomboid family serine protease
MYAMAKILGLAGGPAIPAGSLGLLPSCQDLMMHLSRLVLGAVDYPVWLVWGAAQRLFGWESFSASVAGLGLGLLVVLCFERTEQRLKRLLLSWQ